MIQRLSGHAHVQRILRTRHCDARDEGAEGPGDSWECGSDSNICFIIVCRNLRRVVAMVLRLFDEVKSENFSDDDIDDNLQKQTRAASVAILVPAISCSNVRV